MRTGTAALPLVLALLFLAAPDARGHSLNYHIEQKGIAARVFYADKDPASYAAYEVFGPGDREDIPHQTGRTDKNGFLAFVPDRPGTWKVKIWGESTHGYHGFTAEVQVGRELDLESFRKPLLATHTKLITGLSLIFGLFGIYAYLKSRRKGKTGTG